MSRIQTESHTLPAGKYYLGDPCYSFQKSHSRWIKALETSEYFDKPYTEPRKGTAVAFNTAYGDGRYRDNKGNSYPVDAGMIGLVPVRMADCLPTGVQLVEFTGPVECYKDGGTLTFGPYVIETGNESDNESGGEG